MARWRARIGKLLPGLRVPVDREHRLNTDSVLS